MQTLAITAWTVSGNVSGWLHAGAAAPAMLYDVGNGSANLYRWANASASNFVGPSSINTPSLDPDNVGDRVASGDFNGDGRSDIVAAYQHADGKMSLRVWSQGDSYLGAWYTSGGLFSLSFVAGRLVAGDWNADGISDVAMVYDVGNGTARIYRWISSGSVFNAPTYITTGSFYLSHVEDRVAAGVFNVDASDDIVMAYENSTGTFTYHVWSAANAYAGAWYTSGPFSLGRVDSRLVAGDWGYDGRADVALVYDVGNGTARIYRWMSSGSSFNPPTYVTTGAYNLGNVGDRVAAGPYDADSTDDVVMAYQNSSGNFTYHVWGSGNVYLGGWYTSGTFSLAPVDGRLVSGAW